MSEKAMAPHSSTLAWSSLVGCSPWGHKESDRTKRLHFHFSLSCFGEGNVNPLQCSCLENPRDRRAWWAAVYGVAQGRTQLKWLSSSNEHVLSCFSPVSLCATPWTVAHQAPLFMGFSGQEYWSGLPFPSPGDLPTQGLNSCFSQLLRWQEDSLSLELPGKPLVVRKQLKLLFN